MLTLTSYKFKCTFRSSIIASLLSKNVTNIAEHHFSSTYRIIFFTKKVIQPILILQKRSLFDLYQNTQSRYLRYESKEFVILEIEAFHLWTVISFRRTKTERRRIKEIDTNHERWESRVIFELWFHRLLCKEVLSPVNNAIAWPLVFFYSIYLSSCRLSSFLCLCALCLAFFIVHGRTPFTRPLVNSSVRFFVSASPNSSSTLPHPLLQFYFAFQIK